MQHGYALVIQDVRGRYESEGVFEPLAQEASDSDDTLDWIAEQPWLTGKIGMLGGSYSGIVQWHAAETNNPHLKAIFPAVSGDDDYFDRFYSRGGAMKLGHRLLWFAENMRAPGTPLANFQLFTRHLPLRTADQAATRRTISVYQEALDHPAYDDFWRRISVRTKLDSIRVPVFALGGWYDNYVESDLEAFGELARHPGQNRLMIGPWPHNMSQKFAGVDYGPDSMPAIRALQIAWFDYWLKGPRANPQSEALMRQPPLRIFMMGSNQWRDEREWPLPETRHKALYLRARATPTRFWETARWGPARRASRSQIPSRTIPAIRRRRAAARCAATRRSFRGARWISARWRNAMTSWCTRRLRWPRTCRWPAGFT